ncbi:IclR family transcriptional regulator [Kineococcus indalonis]|uniref:hypothetical protein n=1 Tax=Kineococcus indalonis TaxID=2696566 RepID=UPI0014136DBB|nr:hypothetical protein [Kineococcus indalonis]NAZ85910.1 hypothetical protein [Kineococcus indalonis]
MSAAAGSVRALDRAPAILDVVAASAKEVPALLDCPLPTTYRLLQVLTRERHLVHLREELAAVAAWGVAVVLDTARVRRTAGVQEKWMPPSTSTVRPVTWSEPGEAR